VVIRGHDRASPSRRCAVIGARRSPHQHRSTRHLAGHQQHERIPSIAVDRWILRVCYMEAMDLLIFRPDTYHL
jgi:hypothetical protein